MIDIIKKIKEISSTKGKEQILLDHKDNESLKRLLHFVYSPHIVTGISNAKINKGISLVNMLDANIDCRTMDSLFSYLEINNTGRDKDIAFAHSFIDRQPLEDREFWMQVVTKSLKIGVTAKTLNKVYGDDFINTWEVQQAYPYEEYPFPKDEWYSLSVKMNGNRYTYLNGEFKSRQGHILKGVDYIIEAIDELGYKGYFIDGELSRLNYDDIPDDENFRIGTGIVNSNAEVKEGLVFTVFDLFPAHTLKDGECPLAYSQRLIDLENLAEDIEELGIDCINTVGILYQGKNQSEIDKWVDILDGLDREGCMINLDVPYKCKRHRGILKAKKFKTCDLRIVGYKEGTGKHKGRLGSFTVDLMGMNTVDIGSGYTDEEREKYWANKEDLVGRVIEIRYKGESKDKKSGLPSLQFPTFKGIREISKEPSMN